MDTKSEKADLGVISKGIISGVCSMQNIKSLSLTVQ